MFGFKKVVMPKAGEALPGRASPIRTAAAHFINHHALKAISGRLREGDIWPRMLLSAERSSGNWAMEFM